MLYAVLGYLGAGATEMAAEAQAECLLALEETDAVTTATRAQILSTFTAALGYSADGDYSPRSWLIHRTRITKGAAAGHLAWARRAAAHPRIVVALAERAVSESYARKICEWSDKLPPDCRDTADAILIAAAQAGADLTDLVQLAAEMYTRSLPDPGSDDDQPEDTFEDRAVRVETTFDGAGVISGDLSPECAAVVTAVLESLAAPMGAEDTRTKEQRYHDGLQEAMRRLIAAGLLPSGPDSRSRSGPTSRWPSCGRSMTGRYWPGSGSPRWPRGGPPAALRPPRAAATAGRGWTARPPGRWPATRSSPRSLLVTWTPVYSMTWCDCVSSWTASTTPPTTPAPASDDLASDGRAGSEAPASPSREALRKAIIGKAVDLLSGPGGLASFLRTRQLGARLAGPSLPLDIGFSKTIPPGIRNAVILRDRRCRWPGGCHQPAAACEVHHVKHLSHGGPTSLTDCVLLCSYHHQIVIHRWGWTLVLNPDGTTTAWNPDRTKVLHSHSPPARAG